MNSYDDFQRWQFEQYAKANKPKAPPAQKAAKQDGGLLYFWGAVMLIGFMLWGLYSLGDTPRAKTAVAQGQSFLVSDPDEQMVVAADSAEEAAIKFERVRQTKGVVTAEEIRHVR